MRIPLKASAIAGAAVLAGLPVHAQTQDDTEIVAWVCGSVSPRACELAIIEGFATEIARIFLTAEAYARQLQAYLGPGDLERFRELHAMEPRDRLAALRRPPVSGRGTTVESFMAEVVSILMIAEVADTLAQARIAELGREIRLCGTAANFVCVSLANQVHAIDGAATEIRTRARNVARWLDEVAASLEAVHGAPPG